MPHHLQTAFPSCHLPLVWALLLLCLQYCSCHSEVSLPRALSHVLLIPHSNQSDPLEIKVPPCRSCWNLECSERPSHWDPQAEVLPLTDMTSVLPLTSLSLCSSHSGLLPFSGRARLMCLGPFARAAVCLGCSLLGAGMVSDSISLSLVTGPLLGHAFSKISTAAFLCPTNFISPSSAFFSSGPNSIKYTMYF